MRMKTLVGRLHDAELGPRGLSYGLGPRLAGAKLGCGLWPGLRVGMSYGLWPLAGAS